MPLHPLAALANRFADDAAADTLALSYSSPDSAIPVVKRSTERILLEATPKAARRLSSIVECGSDKDAVAASKLIFDNSPATSQANMLGQLGGASFSNEALEMLFMGLKNFSSYAANGSAREQADAIFADATIIQEEPDEKATTTPQQLTESPGHPDNKSGTRAQGSKAKRKET